MNLTLEDFPDVEFSMVTNDLKLYIGDQLSAHKGHLRNCHGAECACPGKLIMLIILKRLNIIYISAKTCKVYERKMVNCVHYDNAPSEECQWPCSPYGCKVKFHSDVTWCSHAHCIDHGLMPFLRELKQESLLASAPRVCHGDKCICPTKKETCTLSYHPAGPCTLYKGSLCNI